MPIVSPSVTISLTEAIKVTITPTPSEAVKVTVTLIPSESITSTVTPTITEKITPTKPSQTSERAEVTEIPTIIETEQWITRQDDAKRISFLWVSILVYFLCILCFIFLFFYGKKRFHGIFADTLISGTKEEGDKNPETKETWFVPELVHRVNSGEITIETYIKTLKHCGVSTIFPKDTKMKISIQEDSIVLDANEKKLFEILQKANSCVKVTITSSKEDIWIELVYYKK